MRKPVHHSAGAKLAGFVVLASLAAAAAAAPQYSLKDLGTLGGTSSWGWGINNSGQSVGWSQTAGGSMHGAVFGAGAPADLPTLGGNSSLGFDINNAGLIVGQAQLADGSLHAALFSGGGVFDLAAGPGSGVYSVAYGINDANQIGGYIRLADKTTHAASFTGGVVTSYAALGGENSLGYGIGSGGAVIGAAQLANGTYHAASFYAGVVHDLGTLGGGYTSAYSMNASGQVAGMAQLANGKLVPFMSGPGGLVQLGVLAAGDDAFAVGINDAGDVIGEDSTLGHAFLYRAGVMQDLNDLIEPGSGWIVQEAVAFNDFGDISATACDASRAVCHAVLLQNLQADRGAAAPEPGTLALVGVALSGLLWRARQRSSSAILRWYRRLG